MKPSDISLGINNDATESDPVYTSVVNWDLRKAIRERTMSQKTYQRAYKLITKGLATALPGPAERSLVLRSQNIIHYQKELVTRLDNLTDGILSLESGLSWQTVKRLQQKGRTGSEIVDLGFILKDQKTSSESIQRMVKQGVDDWSDLIDASRSTKCSAAMLLRIMADIGTSDVNDILGIIEDAGATVCQYAEEHKMNEGRAWFILFQIYASVGRGDIGRSLDIFNGQFLCGWDEANSNYLETV
jgi:hypothetical protein